MSYYADLLQPDEVPGLDTAQARGLEDEIGLLRALIRRAGAIGDVAILIELVRTLTSTAKVHRQLRADGSTRLDDALKTVLSEIGDELGLDL